MAEKLDRGLMSPKEYKAARYRQLASEFHDRYPDGMFTFSKGWGVHRYTRARNAAKSPEKKKGSISWRSHSRWCGQGGPCNRAPRLRQIFFWFTVDEEQRLSTTPGYAGGSDAYYTSLEKFSARLAREKLVPSVGELFNRWYHNRFAERKDIIWHSSQETSRWTRDGTNGRTAYTKYPFVLGCKQSGLLIEEAGRYYVALGGAQYTLWNPDKYKREEIRAISFEEVKLVAEDLIWENVTQQ